MIKFIDCIRSGELVGPDGLALDPGAVYSRSFLDQINHAADGVVGVSDYINEIFMHFYLRVMEIASLFRLSGAERVRFRARVGQWSSVAMAAKGEGLPIGCASRLLFCLSGAALYVLAFFLVLLSALVLPGLALLTRHARATDVAPVFSVIRSPAAYGKMRFLSETGQVAFYYDDLLQRKSSAASMYAFGTAHQRGFSLLIVPLLAVRDYLLVASDCRKLLGWEGAGFVLYYFSKRIAHKCIFEYYFELLVKSGRCDTYYTGNKEDRFAILEKRLCKHYGVRAVCVPHGIEYAFRTPAGLVGDTFYCTTEQARRHLTGLYPGAQQFLFDEYVARQMFSRHQEVSPVRGLVFFPESRGLEVNRAILGELLGLGYPVAVKLHPRDSVEHYRDYAGRVTFVSDYDASISSKVCVARKSTVLVEAIYNNSTPVAVLTDQRDRAYVEHMLPSLTDSQIRRVYSVEELAYVLDELRVSA
ncbi:hypothetical protein [Pseudomonas sp. MBLB4136]|uniref:hypothetical protein n=1 Tax=Pseudomonas sp. MBLB4136 TaxID=3451558 RepID=UPI003F754E52